jgi:hypothetical protein
MAPTEPHLMVFVPCAFSSHNEQSELHTRRIWWKWCENRHVSFWLSLFVKLLYLKGLILCPAWPQTHDAPASTSLVLGLQVCATTHSHLYRCSNSTTERFTRWGMGASYNNAHTSARHAGRLHGGGSSHSSQNYRQTGTWAPLWNLTKDSPWPYCHPWVPDSKN